MPQPDIAPSAKGGLMATLTKIQALQIIALGGEL
jgi:hypothetical protein